MIGAAPPADGRSSRLGLLWNRLAHRATGSIFTIEEHSIIGGLGSAVMEVLTEEAPAAVVRIGLPDGFLESGTPAELRAKYGLTARAIATRVREVCCGARVSVPACEEPGRQRVQHA